MPIKKTANIKNQIRAIKSVEKKMPRKVGNRAVRFFKWSFRLQGFYDKSIRKWYPRKAGAARNKGRGILIDSGRLRRSIRVIRASGGITKVGTQVPYAGIHNKGGVIRRQVTVDPYFRRAHTRTWKGKTVKVGQSAVRRHQRKMNLNIRKRQFMGNSYRLTREIRVMFYKEIRRAFKN